MDAVIVFFSVQNFVNPVIRIRFILKFRNPAVGKNNLRGNFRFQHNTFQSPAARKCHIHLTRSKRFSCIDDKTVESKTLGFMNRNRPGKTDRILFKTAQNLFLNAFVFAQRIAFLFPGFFFEFVNLVFTIDDNAYFLIINLNNFSQFTVEISFFAACVVSDKHDLCPDFKLQNFIIRELVFIKIPNDFRIIKTGLPRKCCQFFLIDFVGHPVVRSEVNIRFIFRFEIRQISFVQCIEVDVANRSVTDFIQNFQEFFIFLAVNRCKFERDERKFLQRITVEEKRGIVILFQDIFVAHNRR